MRKTVALTIALVIAFSSMTQAAMDLIPAPRADGQGVDLIYDSTSGNLSVEGNGELITTFELVSASNLFRPGGLHPDIIMPPFDVANATKLFKLSTDGFADLDFGPVLDAGLTAEALSADFTLNGSVKPNGSLPSPGLYVHVVPEPASIGLALAGFLGLLCIRRK